MIINDDEQPSETWNIEDHEYNSPNDYPTAWNKSELVALFNEMIPDFKHKETGKYLDNRM